jgi:hypothetical protein
VRVLEASSDLSIGDYGLSAGRLQATRLTEGRVPLVGVAGAITVSVGLLCFELFVMPSEIPLVVDGLKSCAH